MIVKFKLAPGAIEPRYQTEGAVGMDLHAYLPSDLSAGNMSQVILSPYTDEGDRLIVSRTLISTGVSIQMSYGYEAQVRGRSGLAKRGILAHVGTIDRDYTGNIGVILYNFSNEDFVVRDGDRIAQLVISPVVRVERLIVDELEPTARGEGGFGSTGITTSLPCPRCGENHGKHRNTCGAL